MSNIFSILGIKKLNLKRNEKRQLILDEYCPVLNSNELHPPPPEPEPDELPILTDEEEKEVDELEFPPVVFIHPNNNVPPRNNHSEKPGVINISEPAPLVPLIPGTVIFIIICLCSLVAVYLGIQALNQISDNPIAPVVTTTDVENPTSNPTNNQNLPSGEWAVRAYRSDDADIIIVNGHIVAAATTYTKETGWISINDYFIEGVNHVAVVNINGLKGGTWGFSLRHDDNIVWGNEGDSSGIGIQYIQVVEILPNGEVNEVNLQDFSKGRLVGDWAARAVASDFGIISVNGIPVSASYSGRDDVGWSKIGNMLYANQNNIVSVSVWSVEGLYSWDFALREGDTIVWGSENEGTGQKGEVFYRTVIVDGSGEVIP